MKVSLNQAGPVAIAALAAGLAALPARASSFTGTGAGFEIPVVGVFTSDIEVTDNFSITDITVTLNDLTHTWAGDLIAELTSPVGTTVSLFNRVGRVTAGFGYSSNFGGDYSFNDTFTGNLWTAADPPAVVIPGGDYFPTGAGSSALVPMLASLAGESSQGIWRLTISDNAGGDIGSLGSWTLELQGPMAAVPEPSAVLGLGVLGLAAFGKRQPDRDEA